MDAQRNSERDSASLDDGLLLAESAVEAIARRVAELLTGGGLGAPTDLVTALEIARRFNVERSWVYSNARKLGAVRLGSGPKARLRFDPAHVAAVLHSDLNPRDEPRPPKSKRRGRPRKSALPHGIEPLRGRMERR